MTSHTLALQNYTQSMTGIRNIITTLTHRLSAATCIWCTHIE